MAAGNVPTGNVSAFYGNTTAGVTASPTAIDAAIQDIIQTINDNWSWIQILVAQPELGFPDGSVTTNKIRDLAVSTQKLADAGVTTIKIADGTITTAKLADLLITAAKIADGTITEPKYGTGSVSSRAIATGAVGATKLDPALYQQYGDIALNARFGQIDAQLADVVNYRGASYLSRFNPQTDDDITELLNSQLALAPIVKVVVPAGKFKITGRVVVPQGKQIVLQGKEEIIKNIYAPESYFDADNFTILDVQITNGVAFELRKFSMISGGYIKMYNSSNSVGVLIDAGNFECHHASFIKARISSNLYQGNTAVKFNLDNTTSATIHDALENTFDLIVTGFDVAYLFKRAITASDIFTIPVLTDFIIDGYISGCVQSFKWDCVRGFNGNGSVVNARIQAVTLTAAYQANPHIEMRYANDVHFKTPVWDLGNAAGNTIGILFDNSHKNVFHYFYISDNTKIVGNQGDNIFLLDLNKPNIMPVSAVDGATIIGDQHNILKGNRGLYIARCKYTYNNYVPDYVDINSLEYSNLNGYGVKDPSAAETFKLTGLNYLFDERTFSMFDLNRECIVSADGTTVLDLRVDFIQPMFISQIGIALNDVFLPENLKIIVTLHDGTVITKMDKTFTILGISAGVNNVVYKKDLNVMVKYINFVMTGVCTNSGTVSRDNFRIQNIWVSGNAVKSKSAFQNYFYDRDKLNVYNLKGGAINALFGAPFYSWDFRGMSSLPADVVKATTDPTVDEIIFNDGLIVNRLINSTSQSIVQFNHSFNSGSNRYLVIAEVLYFDKRMSAFFSFGTKNFSFANMSGFQKGGGMVLIQPKNIGINSLILKLDAGGATVTPGNFIKIRQLYIYDISATKYDNLDLYRIQNGFNSSLDY